MIDVRVERADEVVLCRECILHSGLQRGQRAHLVLAQQLTGVRVGERFTITVEDPASGSTAPFPLVVRDFRLPRDGDGGWIDLSDDVVSTEPPFGMEIFARQDGVAAGDVIESRIPLDDPPTSFSQREYPVVVVSDLPMYRVIDDLCARCGAHWWLEDRRLVVRDEFSDARTEIVPSGIEETPEGIWLRPDRWTPLGTPLNTADGDAGVVTAVRIEGEPPVLWIHCGRPPRPQPAPPHWVWTLPATLHQPRPVSVDLPSGRGGDVVASADLMVREGPDFRETLPLRQGTPLRVELQRGGVSTELPVAWVGSPGEPGDAYGLTATECRAELDRLSVKVSGNASMAAGKIDLDQL